MNCEECNKMFSSKDILVRHAKEQHPQDYLLCDVCGFVFANKRKLDYHRKKTHISPAVNISQSFELSSSSRTTVPPAAKRMKMNDIDDDDDDDDTSELCSNCNVSVLKKYMINHYKSMDHKNNCLKNYSGNDENVQLIVTAFKSRINSFRVSDVPNDYISVNDFMYSVKHKIIELIKLQIKIFNAAKTNFELFGLFTKHDLKDDVYISSLKSFNTKNLILTEASDLDEIFSQIVCTFNTQSEEFQEKESGWAIEKILFIEINFNKYSPMRGSSYLPLPKFIKDKKAIVNVQNSDQACFAWSIMASKQPNARNPQRCTSYHNYRYNLNLNNITFPMALKDIPQFENQNNMSVNVYGLEGNQIVGPLYYTNSKKSHHANLLYLEDGENTHYCYIKKLNTLVGKQLTKRTNKKFICDGCLIFFRNERKLNNHLQHGCNKIKCLVPNKENCILKFKNYQNKERVPFIIYCDFEAILSPINTCLPNPKHSFSENISKHEPCSFAYYIKCSYDDSLSKFELYRGEDCGKQFIEKIKADLEVLYVKLNTKLKMMALTNCEQLQYNTSSCCHICKKSFNDPENYKVRDHCHLTGKFRGAAHVNCNLSYQIVDFVPIICHNLSGYDSHFIIKELGFDEENIDLIAQNKERYISFTKHFKINNGKKIKLRFIDSFKFMASSLDNLAKNLEVDQFCEIRKLFTNQDQFNLITKKGVFPYEYLDSHEKFNDSCLPPQPSFYNKLNDYNITDEQYNHANKVWSEFNCKNLGDYSDLYLKSDVLLLADIFENFRNVCLKTYNLDPAHYYTSPGLSWDAMLKHTNIEMELLTDIDMINFIKKGVRGGLAQCSKRYSKANNKYMRKYSKKDDENSNYIIYLDANNLYGHAMSQYLPYANFKWLKNSELNKFDINLTNDDDELGYILECDLDYPEILHKSHNDLPFCVENIKPDYTSSKQKKLIANLKPKSNYIIHQQNLKQCLSEGLILKKIHRVLQFNQKPFLKSYIDLNTNLRTQAKNSFEKDFFKLMNNSVFGKTLEDVFKRKDIRMLTHWENIENKLGANNLINKPNFHSSSVFNENLVAIQMNRLQITLNKPIYVGFSVLELSKTLMYDFHYKYFIPKYKERAALLYTDTDSLIYEIQTDDFYKDIEQDIDSRFDTSDFSPQNVFGLPLKNKKVLGMFKDECNGKIITEFIGLKAKTYCILLEDDNEITKKIKGIKKSVVSNKISFNDYKNCLNKDEKIIRSQLNFKSRKHHLFTQLVNKLALTNDDDKRFVIPNSYNTLAWGNKDLENFEIDSL